MKSPRSQSMNQTGGFLRAGPLTAGWPRVELWVRSRPPEKAEMSDRVELLEAALNALPDGMALLGEEGVLRFWNHAAEEITGYAAMDLLGRPVPEPLAPLVLGSDAASDAQSAHPGRGALVQARHRLGHEIPAIARIQVLRDALGNRIGTAAAFHPADSLDALPLGDNTEGCNVAISQAGMEERLRSEFEDFERSGMPFGVLWITVDQAHALRLTHGMAACEAMLDKVEEALTQGLRPAEELGRWGDDEFLVISHERTAQMLAQHAGALASHARTADFRWWGDRISLSASIGAAQAGSCETLLQLLDRAHEAMLTSMREGGNRITPAQGEPSCLPS